jgi:hypothetical protein
MGVQAYQGASLAEAGGSAGSLVGVKLLIHSMDDLKLSARKVNI